MNKRQAKKRQKKIDAWYDKYFHIDKDSLLVKLFADELKRRCEEGEKLRNQKHIYIRFDNEIGEFREIGK